MTYFLLSLFPLNDYIFKTSFILKIKIVFFIYLQKAKVEEHYVIHFMNSFFYPLLTIIDGHYFFTF